MTDTYTDANDYDEIQRQWERSWMTRAEWDAEVTYCVGLLSGDGGDGQNVPRRLVAQYLAMQRASADREGFRDVGNTLVSLESQWMRVAGMRSVPRVAFYDALGPQNVHPSPTGSWGARGYFTLWKRPDGTVVGASDGCGTQWARYWLAGRDA